MVRILIITPSFRAEEGRRWLLDDLATELVRQGHAVDVVVHNPTVARPRGERTYKDGVRTFSVGATRDVQSAPAKLLSYLVTGLRAHTSGLRWASRGRYDLCVFTSIGLFSFGLPARLRRTGVARRLLFVLWDFFPVHQVEVGRMSAGVHVPVLKWLEFRSFARADVVAVMSRANDRFLSAYHPGAGRDRLLVPPWAAVDAPTIAERRPGFTVMFGGQLVKGRGLETLIDAAVLLGRRGTDVTVLIAGDGAEADHFRDYARQIGAESVEFVGRLPRDEYRALLRSCHIGVAVTVAGISPPSFPSKIVEYCANGVPVIVAVEGASDAGSFIEERGVGISVVAGDSEGLADAIEELAGEWLTGALERRAQAARRVFDEELSVERAAEAILQAARRPDPEAPDPEGGVA